MSNQPKKAVVEVVPCAKAVKGSVIISGNKVKLERIRRELSMGDVSKLSGVSKATICRTEAGRLPDLTTAIRLAKTFRMTVEELWIL